MIDFVSGTLVGKKHALAVVDIQGLGYRLLIPMSTYEKLPAIGEPVRLLAYQHVREDALLLFGFATEAERIVFELMIGTSGIGPKLALAALSTMSPTEIRRYVLDGDSGLLTSIPGVGRKTAERLIIDLRDRVVSLEFDAAGALPLSGAADARIDALAALEILGFTRAGAERRIRKVLRANPGAVSADELIRLALRD